MVMDKGEIETIIRAMAIAVRHGGEAVMKPFSMMNGMLHHGAELVEEKIEEMVKKEIHPVVEKIKEEIEGKVKDEPVSSEGNKAD